MTIKIFLWVWGFVFITVQGFKTGKHFLNKHEVQERDFNCAVGQPQSCAEAYRCGDQSSGLKAITVSHGGPTTVFCDQDTDGGGWLVVQRRNTGHLLFNRSWTEYEKGFGSPGEEFWIGNQFLNTVTQHEAQQLRVEITDWDGTTKYAQYGVFSVAGPTDKYRLTIGQYSGTAGDSMSYLNGAQFSTYDQDNDMAKSMDCSAWWGGNGGWWFKICSDSNPNGEYGPGHGRQGIYWYTWRESQDYFMSTEIKIRPPYDA